MPLWVWISLAISLGLVIPTLIYLTVAGFSLWRRIVALEEAAGVPLESLLASVETMNERLDRANANAEDIQGRLEHLNATMEKVAVIRWALGDTRNAMGLWKALAGR